LGKGISRRPDRNARRLEPVPLRPCAKHRYIVLQGLNAPKRVGKQLPFTLYTQPTLLDERNYAPIGVGNYVIGWKKGKEAFSRTQLPSDSLNVLRFYDLRQQQVPKDAADYASPENRRRYHLEKYKSLEYKKNAFYIMDFAGIDLDEVRNLMNLFP
jgi:hypothetical protein